MGDLGGHEPLMALRVMAKATQTARIASCPLIHVGPNLQSDTTTITPPQSLARDYGTLGGFFTSGSLRPAVAVAVLLACGLAGQGKIGFTLRRAAYPGAVSGLWRCVLRPTAGTLSRAALMQRCCSTWRPINWSIASTWTTTRPMPLPEPTSLSYAQCPRTAGTSRPAGVPGGPFAPLTSRPAVSFASIETNRTDICAWHFLPMENGWRREWRIASTTGPGRMEALYELWLWDLSHEGGGPSERRGTNARGRDCVPSRWKAHGLFERRGNIAALGCNDASRTQAVRDVETAGRQRRG